MHLLFDLDGTLTDPFPGIIKSIQHALVALDHPAPPDNDLRWCIGPPLRQVFATLLDTRDTSLIESAVLKYRDRFGTVGLFENDLYPGIETALAELKRSDHTLGVATSKPAVFAVRIIEHFGLKPYFRSIDGSEMDGTRADKTSLIAYILKRDAIAPADTIMIGDREYDMIGARQNGVAALGVLWGYGSRAELEAAGAFACITSPQELPTALAQISVR